MAWPLKTTFANGNPLTAAELNAITTDVNTFHTDFVTLQTNYSATALTVAPLTSSSYPDQNVYYDGSYTRFAPYATQLDSFSGANSISANASVTITFNYSTTRFTHTPMAFVSVYNTAGASTIGLVANVTSVSGGTVTARIYNAGTTTIGASDWAAYCHMVQATRASSNG